jgi:hypothetical protein
MRELRANILDAKYVYQELTELIYPARQLINRGS